MSATLQACLIAALALSPLAVWAQSPLPEGKAKPLVERMCSSCHALHLIQNSSGYTREHWKELIGAMIDVSRDPELQNDIARYLADNFPPNNRRAPKLVAGEFEVTFKEWVTPQLGQRTRDPMQASDGSIWYAGQYGNLIGASIRTPARMRRLAVRDEA